MPTLSQNDPEPDARTGPSVWIVAAIVLVIALAVVLHLTGIVGPG